MIRGQTRLTTTDQLLPYTTSFRSTGTPIGESTTAMNDGDVVVKPLETPGTRSAQPTIEAAPLAPPVPMISEPKAVREPYSLQALNRDRKSTRLNSSHSCAHRMPSSA